MGISTTPLTGGIVAILIGLSMSLKSSISLVASGIIIVSTRPFKIGEFVDIGGTSGAVKDINFVFCSLRTTDGRAIKVPNTLVTSRVITISTSNEFRRNDFIIGIGYSSDLVRAKELLQGIINNESRILQEEGKAPIIRQVCPYAAAFHSDAYCI